VTWELFDPCPELPNAATLEAAIFAGGCPSDKQLGYGDTKSAVARQTVTSTSQFAPFPAFSLQKYGFAFLARDANCAVRAFGCTEASPTGLYEIKTALGHFNSDGIMDCAPYSGATCPSGEGCSSGSCQATDADCSLGVIASGPLTVSGGATKVTGPAITATDAGFVIGFRTESKSAGYALRAELVFLSGGAIAKRYDFDIGGCSNASPSDGVSLAYRGGSGLFATSIPDCGSGAGAALVPFDVTLSPSEALGPLNAAFSSLTIANAGALAPAATDGEFDFVYRVVVSGVPATQRVVLAGASFKDFPTELPFGAADIQFARVASSDAARALLGRVAYQIDVLVGPNSSDTLATVGTFSLPAAPFAALHAWDKRVVAGVPTPTGFAWEAVGLAGDSIYSVSTADENDGTPGSADLDVINEDLLLAEAWPGTLSFKRYPGANGNLSSQPKQKVVFWSKIGDMSLDQFDGTHMAVATSVERVAVAWIDNTLPTEGAEVVGGWAILKCLK